MALVLEQIEENIWSNFYKTKCVRSRVGIRNDSENPILINGIQILNRISNPQEIGSFESFAFHFGNPISFTQAINTDGISVPTVNNTSLFIDYPNYYQYQPGNEVNEGLGNVMSFESYYRFAYKFTIDAGETFWFDLQFSPKEYNIDFYQASLLIHWYYEGLSGIKKWKMSASLIPNINEIDHASFPDDVFSIQGMNPYQILTGM